MRITPTRRVCVSSVLVTALTAMPPPTLARVKGAAEMDLEFYARGLLGGSASPAPKTQLPPVSRQLDERLAAAMLSAVAAGMAPSVKMSPAELRTAAAALRPQLAIEYDRVNAVGAFGGGAGYDAAVGARTAASYSESQQQFGFDLSVLALFTVLADAKLGRRESADVSRRIGEELLGVFPPAARCTDRDSLGTLIASWRALLDELKAAGYIDGYSVDDSDADEALWKQKSSLSPTRLTVTLNDSATLRAALLLNGRGVSPEIARPLLTAFAASCGARVVEQAEYFLDDYRESPLEYRASQTLLSYTLAPE